MLSWSWWTAWIHSRRGLCSVSGLRKSPGRIFLICPEERKLYLHQLSSSLYIITRYTRPYLNMTLYHIARKVLTGVMEGRKARHINFSSEPPQNSRPFNTIFSVSSSQIKLFLKNRATLYLMIYKMKNNKMSLVLTNIGWRLLNISVKTIKFF